LIFVSRWVLYANHAEPVKSYLTRHLQRQLIQYEVQNQVDENLRMIVEWIPRLWLEINKCIETYNSTDVTFGPKLFANVPMDANASKCWFFDLWNNTLVPHIVETVIEGVQVGTRYFYRLESQNISNRGFLVF
jgi:neuron navigator 2